MLTLVLNEAVRSCCGTPTRNACTCGRPGSSVPDERSPAVAQPTIKVGGVEMPCQKTQTGWICAGIPASPHHPLTSPAGEPIPLPPLNTHGVTTQGQAPASEVGEWLRTFVELLASRPASDPFATANSGSYPDCLPLPDSSAIIANERRQELRELEQRKHAEIHAYTDDVIDNAPPGDDTLPLPVMNWEDPLISRWKRRGRM